MNNQEKIERLALAVDNVSELADIKEAVWLENTGIDAIPSANITLLNASLTQTIATIISTAKDDIQAVIQDKIDQENDIINNSTITLP